MATLTVKGLCRLEQTMILWHLHRQRVLPMPRRPTPIVLTDDERNELDRLIRAGSTSQQTALRARMIVMAADGVGVAETAQTLHVWRKGVIPPSGEADSR
jgi:hypothetical protein